MFAPHPLIFLAHGNEESIIFPSLVQGLVEYLRGDVLYVRRAATRGVDECGRKTGWYLEGSSLRASMARRRVRSLQAASDLNSAISPGRTRLDPMKEY